MHLPDVVELEIVGLSLGKLGRMDSVEDLVERLRSDALPQDLEYVDQLLLSTEPLVPAPAIWVAFFGEGQSSDEPESILLYERLQASPAAGFTAAELLWRLYRATYDGMRHTTRDYVLELGRYGSDAWRDDLCGQPPSRVAGEPVYFLGCAS